MEADLSKRLFNNKGMSEVNLLNLIETSNSGKSAMSVTYKIRVGLILLMFLLILSCKKDDPTVPVITTDGVTGISATTAVSGGEVTDAGGVALISKGVCWSTKSNPAISDSHTTHDGTTGKFTSNLTGLSSGTTYFVRAYAVNSVGTAYGNQVSFATLAVAPDKPAGVKITPGNYSLTLSWDNPSDQQSKTVRIFRDTVPGPSGIYKEIPYTNTFKDVMVALDTRYYYKISLINNSNLESEKSVEVSATPLEPVNTSNPVNGEIGGLHYAFWDFPAQTFTKLVHNFTIYNEPLNKDNSLNKDGLYYQFYQGIMNDTIGFYYGIQTSVMKPDGNNKKGVIFSRWKTRDISNYKIAPGGWGQSAGYEGDFIGVRKNYEWVPGTYSIELRKDSADDRGDWYGLWLSKVPNGTKEYMGSIRFERSSKSSGIKDGGITWTELYFKSIPNSPLPRWHVSVNDVLADNQRPLHVTTSYSADKFVGFTNIFTTNSHDVQFLMGPEVVRFHPAGLLW
jgi:hypothetical protein